MDWKKFEKDSLIVLILSGLFTVASYLLGLKIFVRTRWCFQAPCPNAGFDMPSPYFIPLWILAGIIIVILYNSYNKKARS